MSDKRIRKEDEIEEIDDAENALEEVGEDTKNKEKIGRASCRGRV